MSIEPFKCEECHNCRQCAVLINITAVVSATMSADIVALFDELAVKEEAE